MHSTLSSQIAAFDELLLAKKDGGFPWYPYHSLGGLYEIELELEKQEMSIAHYLDKGPVLDLCTADGDVAYFLESQGCNVTAVDLPHTNFNQMSGVRRMRELLDSNIDIVEMDIDTRFALPGRYGLAIFMGALYHLKNPYSVLATLAWHARYAVISTRVARFTPDRAVAMHTAPLAYLVAGDETNNDDTNFWIFSEAGLRRLLERTHWRVEKLILLGNAESSDPASNEGDQRAFCVVESKAFDHPILRLRGWHEQEPDGWFWSERVFSFEVHACTQIELRVCIPELIANELGAITLTVRCLGKLVHSMTMPVAGEYSVRVTLPEGNGTAFLQCELDKAMPPGSFGDKRELGLMLLEMRRIS